VSHGGVITPVGLRVEPHADTSRPVPLCGLLHGTGVRRSVHNPPTLWAARACHPNHCTTDREGGDWGGWPQPDHRRHPVGLERPAYFNARWLTRTAGLQLSTRPSEQNGSQGKPGASGARKTRRGDARRTQTVQRFTSASAHPVRGRRSTVPSAGAACACPGTRIRFPGESRRGRQGDYTN
jgi:hypothetical protein